jgi:hypothetical protein
VDESKKVLPVARATSSLEKLHLHIIKKKKFYTRMCESLGDQYTQNKPPLRPVIPSLSSSFYLSLFIPQTPSSFGKLLGDRSQVLHEHIHSILQGFQLSGLGESITYLWEKKIKLNNNNNSNK